MNLGGNIEIFEKFKKMEEHGEYTHPPV